MNEMAASRKKVVKAYDLLGIMQSHGVTLFETKFLLHLKFKVFTFSQAVYERRLVR
jgi:hypothetical protein